MNSVTATAEVVRLAGRSTFPGTKQWLDGLRRSVARFWSRRPERDAAVDSAYREGFDAGFNGRSIDVEDGVSTIDVTAWREGYEAGRAAWLHW